MVWSWKWRGRLEALSISRLLVMDVAELGWGDVGEAKMTQVVIYRHIWTSRLAHTVDELVVRGGRTDCTCVLVEVSLS